VLQHIPAYFWLTIHPTKFVITHSLAREAGPHDESTMFVITVLNSVTLMLEHIIVLSGNRYFSFSDGHLTLHKNI
jgi:hypothetical protein